MKKCIKCNEEKELTEFRIYKKCKDGHRTDCKICEINRQKQYALNNKEKIKEYDKEYQKKYRKQKKIRDPLFKLRCNIGSNIQIAIKKQGYSKKTNTYKILGCSFKEFKIHLEIKFTKGMNWNNIGQWHLDHIYPVSLAKDEQHLIQLNHYTNFQPLWAIDNIKKGNKII